MGVCRNVSRIADEGNSNVLSLKARIVPKNYSGLIGAEDITIFNDFSTLVKNTEDIEVDGAKMGSSKIGT